MNYTLYQLLWFFLFYSFIGWAIGTSVAAVREHRFIDVGFLFGPYCPAYGFGAVAFAVFLPELKNHLFFLFLGGVILSSAITFSTGFVLENGGTIHGKDFSLVVMSTFHTLSYGVFPP